MQHEPMFIMLADDDESDRLNFKDALEESKISNTLLMLHDGVALMDYLLREDAPLPYLLFLDLNMPRKNGLECLREIKKHPRLANIVIAIYSTSSSEKDIQETYLCGANVYIKKPNDFGVLKQVLTKVVSAASVYRDTPFRIENFLFRT